MLERTQLCTDTSLAGLDDVQKGEEFAKSSSGDEYPHRQSEGFVFRCTREPLCHNFETMQETRTTGALPPCPFPLLVPGSDFAVTFAVERQIYDIYDHKPSSH